MTIIEQEHIDPIKEELIKKIKEADSKYYKESPCIHCGPGNGCDDCRGCEDAKKNWELGEERRKAYNDFKSHFGYSYEQECDYKSIINAEKNYNEYVKLCQSCHGNFGDDCRYCEEFDNSYKALQKLKWTKEEYKRKYNIDYDKQQKELNTIKTETMNDTSKIADCKSIKEWIDINVKEQGAQEFYNNVDKNWDTLNEKVKSFILNNISSYIKPTKIETIKDVADVLNNNEAGSELKNDRGFDIEKICKENKWIVVFPYSDDNIEFRGYIEDELGACENTKFKMIKKGEFYKWDEDCGEPIYKKAKDTTFIEIDAHELEKESLHNDHLLIECVWEPENSVAAWKYLVWNAPYERFNINEDGELFAECVVIDISKLINE